MMAAFILGLFLGYAMAWWRHLGVVDSANATAKEAQGLVRQALGLKSRLQLSLAARLAGPTWRCQRCGLVDQSNTFTARVPDGPVVVRVCGECLHEVEPV